MNDFLSALLDASNPPPYMRPPNLWRGPDQATNRLADPDAPIPAAALVSVAGGAPAQSPGVGGFLSALGGGANQTVQWLVSQGVDAAVASVMAQDKSLLQKFLLDPTPGQGPTGINGRHVDPDSYQVLADLSDKSGRLTADAGASIDDNGSRIRPPAPGKAGAFGFEDDSVEAQALNGHPDADPGTGGCSREGCDEPRGWGLPHTSRHLFAAFRRRACSTCSVARCARRANT